MKPVLKGRTSVLLVGIALCSGACSDDLDVAKQLADDDSPRAEAPSSEGDAPASEADTSAAAGSPCSCNRSPRLMALGCELGEVPLVENDIIQTIEDGSIVAFTACGDAGCQVARWTLAGGTSVISEGWLTGLSASGERLLLGTSGSPATGMMLVDAEGQVTDTGLVDVSGHGLLNAAGDVVVAQKIIDDVAHLARWSAGEVELIQRFDGALSRVFANPDGSAAVGSGDLAAINDSYRWTLQDGFSPGLPGLPAGVTVMPEALSRDGSVIAGRASPSPTYFRWSESDGFEVIASGGASEAILSRDGSVLAGTFGADDVETSRAFRWSREDGAQVLTPGNATFMIDLSDDGSVAVATSAVPDPAEVTYVWDRTNGARTLDEVLDARGVDRSGWVFGMARLLSGDGKVLLGLGTCGGSPTLYRIVL